MPFEIQNNFSFNLVIYYITFYPLMQHNLNNMKKYYQVVIELMSFHIRETCGLIGFMRNAYDRLVVSRLYCYDRK